MKIYSPMQYDLLFFFLFKVYYFPILLLKAFFILFPSTENKYTFDSDPSELGACLINKAC